MRVPGQQRLHSVLESGVVHGFWQVLDSSLFVLNTERVQEPGDKGDVFFEQPVSQECVGGDGKLRTDEAGQQQRVLFGARLAFKKHPAQLAGLRHGVKGGPVKLHLVRVVELHDI